MWQSIMFPITLEIYIKLEMTEQTYEQSKNNQCENGQYMWKSPDREVTEFYKWTWDSYV